MIARIFSSIVLELKCEKEKAKKKTQDRLTLFFCMYLLSVNPWTFSANVDVVKEKLTNYAEQLQEIESLYDKRFWNCLVIVVIANALKGIQKD